ncbi:MAG: enoyl-CoA hydratase/isomerase family protein [Acidobacteria bacterium]|nr:enoyl-CoA hydratase/isomerase family protein [Acidobacteriota bacterium]
MSTPVTVAFDAHNTRAAFTLFDPKGNIITADMVRSLRTALEGMAKNPHLKLITIEGAGRDFSFGASIPEHAADAISRVLPEMHGLIYDLLDTPAPTAALVRGRCFGGGFELALACDFILAEADATFALPEIALGVFPPAASVLLPARVGLAQTASSLLTGETVAAGEWHSRGLLQLVAAPGTLDQAVNEWFARTLAPRSAAALRHGVAAMRMALQSHVRGVLPDIEQLYLNDLMRTHDAVEGIAAFMAKRQPAWTDE